MAKKIYQGIASNSKIYFDGFLKDQSKPFYQLGDDFLKKMDTLSGFKLSVPKIKNVNKSQLSAKIYKSQRHERRVQLMKHQLMEVYDNW